MSQGDFGPFGAIQRSLKNTFQDKTTERCPAITPGTSLIFCGSTSNLSDFLRPCDRLFRRKCHIQNHSHTICKPLKKLNARVSGSILQPADLCLGDSGSLRELLLCQILRSSSFNYGTDHIHLRLNLFISLSEPRILHLFLFIILQPHCRYLLPFYQPSSFHIPAVLSSLYACHTMIPFLKDLSFTIII